MARREVLEKAGGYRPEACHVEDYDLWLRAVSITGLANLPKVLLQYRVGKDGVSSRNLTLQEAGAAKLRRACIAEMLDRPEAGIPFDDADLLVHVYRQYRRKIPLNWGDDSEITLDFFRRMYLSRQRDNTWIQLLPHAHRLFSLQSFRKVLQFGAWYVTNIRHLNCRRGL